MEPGGQEKDVGSLPYSMGYNNPPSFTNESSANLPSAPAADRRRNAADGGSTTIPIIPSPNQTLDQHQNQQQNPPPKLLLYTHKDSYPDPDPAQVANATTPSGASNSKTATAAAQPPPGPPPASGVNTTTSSFVRYRECLKNHAASMGGNVIDGCGEFMPGGEDGTPEALRCAACDCHRNFHRKECDDEAPAGTSSYYTQNHVARHNNTAHHTSLFHTQPQTSLITMPPQHQQQQQYKFSLGYSHGLTPSPTGPMAPMMMAFGGNSGGAAAETSSEDLNTFQYNNAGGQAVQQAFLVSKKRFRTKFTQQQKDRMHEFAEKMGWKIQKQDEQEVQQFCNEVGVKRQVFKVWMHNNKQAMKKKQM